MYCSACGTKLQVDLNYCNRCGQRVGPDKEKGSLAESLSSSLGYVGSAGFIASSLLHWQRTECREVR